MSAHFFISYTGVDRKWAEWIAWQLEAKDYNVIVQAWDFHAGDNFIARMHDASQKAERTLAVLTPEFLKSYFAEAEWTAALAAKRLLPVRVKSFDVPGILRPLVYIDIVGLDKKAACKALLDGVKVGRAKPLEEPPFPLERERKDEPRFPGSLPPLWNIRTARNEFLTGRDTLRADLRRSLEQGRSAALTQQAIAGLGGVGKTTLAIDYAYEYADSYDVVWEVPSEDTLVARAALARLASELGVAPSEEDPRNWEMAREWLEHHAAWLLIFDNASSYEAIADMLPRAGSGHVLVTSRNPNWRRLGGKPLVVESLGPEDGAAFLRSRSGVEGKEAREVSVELGGLPLALEMAAAYIECNQTMRWSGYLQRVRKNPAKYLDAVGRTWAVSLERLEDAAVKVLERLSFLAPEPVDLDLLEGFAGEGADLEEAIGALSGYSLVRVDNNGAVAMHRLLQLAVRERMDEAQRKAVCAEVARRVNERFVYDPEKIETWKPSEPVFPHAAIVGQHAASLEVELETASRLLNEAGLLAKSNGDLEQAETLLRAALAIDQKVYGADHPEVAIRANNIGQILLEKGDLEGALEYTQRALAIDEKAYGEEHPKVAIRANNIGMILKAKGDLEGALEHTQRALAIDEKVYGAEHPKVAIRANNIGTILKEKGDLEGALEYAQRALAIDEKVYGAEHPNVARDANNIGQILQAKGDLEGAIEYTQRALAIDEKVYGAEHPNVAIRANNIGQILQAKGDLDGALKYTQRALAIAEKVYGAEHPNVAIFANNVGQILQAKGDLEGALKYTQRALAIDEKVYGAEHPNVAIRASNIGMILNAKGDLEGALEYTQRALAIDEKAYGAGHPEVATDANNIGLILNAKGDLEGALAHTRRAVAILTKIYGPENPSTRTVAKNLARLEATQKPR